MQGPILPVLLAATLLAAAPVCAQPKRAQQPLSTALRLITAQESAQLDSLLKAGVSANLAKPIAGADLSQYRTFDNSVILGANADPVGDVGAMRDRVAKLIAAAGRTLADQNQSQAGIATILMVYEPVDGQRILEIILAAFDRRKAVELVTKDPKAAGLFVVLKTTVWFAVRRVPLTQAEAVGGRYHVPVEVIADALGKMSLSGPVVGMAPVAPAAPAPSQPPPPGENLVLIPPAGYRVGHEQRTDKQQIIEMIPAGETPQAWSAMLTVFVHFGGIGASPAQFYERARDRAIADCRGAEASLIASGDTNGYPYVLWKAFCPLAPKTGKPEYVWTKALGGKDSFYVVSKSFAREPSAAEAAGWVDYLEKVSLCDTRIAERACAGPAKPAQ